MAVARYIHSVGKPLRFQAMEQEMTENFNRIRLKCEALLAQRIDGLVKQIDELVERNKRKLKLISSFENGI